MVFLGNCPDQMTGGPFTTHVAGWDGEMTRAIATLAPQQFEPQGLLGFLSSREQGNG